MASSVDSVFMILFFFWSECIYEQQKMQHYIKISLGNKYTNVSLTPINTTLQLVITNETVRSHAVTGVEN